MKEKMGFGERNWDDWFEELFSTEKKEKSTTQIIENAFQKLHYENYYDKWIQNFSLNLDDIWNGKSVREIDLKTGNEIQNSSAIVIGRGPSLKKFNHLNLLSNSNFDGAIVCTDGSLINTLKADITPDKFEKFFVVSVDSNDFIEELFDDSIVDEYGNKIKCILSTTISPKVVKRIKKAGIQIFWVHTLFDYNRKKTSFNYIAGVMTRSKNYKKGLPAIQTGGNSGTSSWFVSWYILKCKFVCLIGIDLSYSTDVSLNEIIKEHKGATKIEKENKLFEKAYPVIHNPDFNCDCRQDPIFQYYCNALKEFIPRARKWVKTINSTEGGALFGDGIESTSFKTFLSNFKKNPA